jgi:hypothetical protein
MSWAPEYIIALIEVGGRLPKLLYSNCIASVGLHIMHGMGNSHHNGGFLVYILL